MQRSSIAVDAILPGFTIDPSRAYGYGTDGQNFHRYSIGWDGALTSLGTAPDTTGAASVAPAVVGAREQAGPLARQNGASPSGKRGTRMCRHLPAIIHCLKRRIGQPHDRLVGGIVWLQIRHALLPAALRLHSASPPLRR